MSTDGVPRILIVAVGSDGDINPMLSIASRLALLGRDVEFLANEHYRSKVEAVGLKFVSVGAAETFEKALQQADFWDPFRAFQTMWKALYESFPPLTAELDRRLKSNDIIVASSLALPARMMQELGRAKLVTVHLAPSVLMSPSNPPAGPLGELPTNAPLVIRQAVSRFLEYFILDVHCAADVNSMRKQYGLSPVRQIFSKWMHSPDLVIMAWPEWFAPPQNDWPPNSVCTGFPVYQHSDTYSLSSETQRFLGSGAPPVVFTAGSAMAQGAKHFRCALESVRDTSMRAIFVNRFSDQIPETLPANVHYSPFEPFDKLFPLAAAIQHHGGIGTSIQSLAAGRPQLVIPLAFDQFDNANRLQRLGVAAVSRGHGSRAWRRELSRLLTDRRIAQKCLEVQRLMDQEKHSADRAAQVISDFES